MRNKFRMMLLSMAAVGLVGCSDKLTEDNTQPSSEGVTDGSVTFKINNVGNQTRATRTTGTLDDSFDAGTEYDITRDAGANVVFIFDENGEYVSKSDLQVLSTTPVDGSTNTNDGIHDNKEGEMYFNARIRKSKDNKTLQCIMILNADPSKLSTLSANLTEKTTLDNFIKEYDSSTSNDLGRYESGSKTYFTMSNTVYVKQVSTDEGIKLEIQGPVTISDENIFSTSQDALKNPVIVHVERLSAKFGLTYGTSKDGNGNYPVLKGDLIIMNGDDLNTLSSADLNAKVDPRKWGIKFTGWDVNGTESQIYWVKNLTTDENNQNPVYNAQSGDIEKGTIKWAFEYGMTTKGWNDPSRVRSYWAVDPHYNGTNDKYPEQYRKAEDVSGVTNGIADGNALNYITYKKIGDLTSSKYAPENTFDGYSFLTDTKITPKSDYAYRGSGYKRASTHILAAAQLYIQKDGEEGGEGKDETNYELFDGYCYENTYWKKTNANELIKNMAHQVIAEYGEVVYVEVSGTKKRIDDASVDYNDYFVFKENSESPSPINGATIKGGDGRVMLTLNNGVKLYIENNDAEGGYDEISESKDFKDAIYKAGTAKHYNNGMMYYAIPIEHMVKYEQEKSKASNDYGAVWYNTGSFGVVRNHWYKVNISEIKVPGVPVDDPNQPIIPNDDPDEGGYIAFEIVIVPWHVIEQNVSFE